MEGLETIRAFGWSGKVVEGNVESVDTSQRPEFLLLSLQRWLNIVLDLLAAAIATGLVVVAVGMRGRVSGGQVGVALNSRCFSSLSCLSLSPRGIRDSVFKTDKEIFDSHARS